jgi:TolB-like protein
MNGEAPNSSGRPVLAVLPFVVAQKDGETSLISGGLHEDICGELTRFRSFQVISPASTSVVADLPDDSIGGASHVLRGRVWRLGSHLHLKATLCATRTASQLWSERFEIAPDDVIALEDTLVARIAATLNVKLEEAARDASRRRPVRSEYGRAIIPRGDLRGRRLLSASRARAGAFPSLRVRSPHSRQRR